MGRVDDVLLDLLFVNDLRDERGRFVVVQDDRRTGGYLIITAACRDLDGEVFDSWVFPEDLEGWFEEAAWSVAWDGETASS